MVDDNQQTDNPDAKHEGYGTMPPPPISPIAPLATRDGYYRNAGRKIGDFLLGFFGIILLWIVSVTITGVIIGISTGVIIGISLLSIVIPVAAIIIAFTTKRRFIAFGMLTAMLLGIIGFLLLLGWCMSSGL